MDGWQRMDRAALDDAYANAAYIADDEGYPPRWQAAAAAFRARARGELDIPYADTPGAGFDLFMPDDAPRGLIVFVHGGYWHKFGKSDWSHLAAGGLAAGHAVAVVGYPLAPRVRLAEITRHVAAAIDAAADRVAGPIRLTGHSAGGHLVARAVMPDAAPACIDRVATCVPISPLADLRPFVAQSMNDELRLDAAEAAAESPLLARPYPGPSVAIHVGAEERPAFLWQAQRLGAAWEAPVRVAPGRHHFDVIDALTEPGSPIMTDLLAR
ncbi:alpha/beta hydrolase [Jannaschia ovalis]|uniref:Alpha/beta hydrolase fold domain-containing protein n=1 Tax=Jannaschia ovalis TaxID=3038773 RepID=A0ABY8LI64_9RHOB|nr:alpha/beta hydrolase fold domain-containing protein [Jannaschia sp. GRR-S6-38]WGH79874.1 alpha/beta hydrolase fold domain-containing protein [Jannaschia sp. GRR-S6-38]